MQDPFADEAQTEISPWDDTPAETSTTTNNSKETVIVQNNEGKVVVTLKGGSGYDAPWIVIHAEDVADAVEQTKEATKELAEVVQKAGAYFAGKAPAKAAPAVRAAAPQQAPQQQGKPAAATQAAGGESRSCAHGEMTFRSGVNKEGHAWKGFFCPTPKGTPDQCRPQFLRG